MSKPAATQVAHPWRATIRTVAAYALAALAFLVAAIPIITDQFGPYLPEGWQAGLAAALGFLVALSGVITRLMALDQAQTLLDRIGLGTGDEDG